MRRIAGLALLLLAAANGAGCNRTPKEEAAPAAPAASSGAAAGDNRGETYKLVMLGDSITAGYGLAPEMSLPVRLQAALRARGVAVDIINAGVSGNTTADALARFDWSVADADGVLIELGGNDLLQGVAPQTTKANLKAIIDRSKAKGLKVMLAGMRAPGNYGAAFQKEFDAIYPALAAEEDVALYPFLLKDVAMTSSLNQGDGIHPNAEGVEKIVGDLAPFIEKAVADQP